ncbi:uncharacterized protein [Lolium perenne]|uniref:uncharacterized protein n=1 Tax=Lolium perenne TaxID=4522 RepID=UPI0021F5E871|nr:uncharacterized protein LOC127329520 [Lolium perenne]
MELLPVDLLADILHRLSAHDLAAARCVHSSWRAVIHSHRLMQLVPLPLAGIFLSFNDHAFSELLARPTPPSAKVSGKLHQYMPTADPVPVADHCNGLLLLSCGYVANPATRRWATLRLGSWKTSTIISTAIGFQITADKRHQKIDSSGTLTTTMFST